MIRDFFKMLLLNKPLFFGLMLLQGVMPILFSKPAGGSFGTQMVLTAFLSQFPIITALYGLKFPKKRALRLYRAKYGFKFVLLFGLADILAVALVLFLSPGLLKNPGLLAIASLATICITKPPILALAGTWLPADLVGHRMSLWTAISRGRQRFWSSYFQVLSISVIDLCLTIAIGDAAFWLSGTLMYGETDLIVEYLTPALIGMCLFLTNCYIGLVLARRYMEAENISTLEGMTSNTGVLLPHAGL